MADQTSDGIEGIISALQLLLDGMDEGSRRFVLSKVLDNEKTIIAPRFSSPGLDAAMFELMNKSKMLDGASPMGSHGQYAILNAIQDAITAYKHQRSGK